MDIPRKPTAHCAEFVGNEWLTPQKTITKQDLLHFIDHQIKWRKMTVTDSYLVNNEYFQRLLFDFRPLIPINEFSNLVEKLLLPNQLS
jgi:hypothetical protein